MGDDDWARASAIIAGGGLLCLPTDTVYGLACNPANPDAMEMLFQVKGRDRTKPVSLIYADPGQLRQALPPLEDEFWNRVERLLSEPVTVILPFYGESGVPQPGDSETGSVGARIVPGRLRDIYARLPLPLALTSANYSGEPEPRTVDEVPETIKSACGFVIDGGACEHGRPTTVVDLRPLASGERPRLLREGAVDRAALRRLMGDIQ